MAVRFAADTHYYHTTVGLPTSATLTFTCWLRIAVDRNDYSEVISFGTTYMSLSADLDGTSVGVFDSGTYNTTPLGATPFTVGTWYRVAVVINGANVSYYRADAATALTHTSATNYTSGTPTQLRIGAYYDGGFWWNGRVAAFKLWQAALNAADITNELAQYQPIRTANLLHYHPFIRTETADYSGNANTLTGGTGSTTEDGPPIPWRITAPQLILPAPTGGTATLDTATETTTARALTGTKTTTPTAATSTHTARPLTATKTATLSIATDTTTPRPLTGTKTRALQPATTPTAAQPITGTKHTTLPAATQPTTAQPLTPTRNIQLGTATETTTARPTPTTKTATLGAATNTHTAKTLPPTKTHTLTPATETTTAQPLTLPVSAAANITLTAALAARAWAATTTDQPALTATLTAQRWTATLENQP